MDRNEIVIYKDGELEIEVQINPEQNTVWLSQQQMAELFSVDRTRIGRHISNIYKEEELDKESTCAENAHMGSLGVQEYKVKYYNLDMIISVGYRVKSKQGIAFRKWASSVLKDYMLKGYAVNDKKTRIFLEFLNKNNALRRNGRQIISDSALVAITLMVSESRPEEKETMVTLMMNFLGGND